MIIDTPAAPLSLFQLLDSGLSLCVLPLSKSPPQMLRRVPDCENAVESPETEMRRLACAGRVGLLHDTGEPLAHKCHCEVRACLRTVPAQNSQSSQAAGSHGGYRRIQLYRNPSRKSVRADFALDCPARQ